MEELTEYQQWCKNNNCSHGHCPFECEHPQPFILDGKLVCGQCAILRGEISVMVPCSPYNC